MALPFFYREDITGDDATITLDEDTSKHVVQVLRMQVGEKIKLTDGKGNVFVAGITVENRKKCEVTILEKSTVSRPQQAMVTLAISPLKNNSRFEWFLEKATEIGVSEIVPLLCERTEKPQLKPERLKSILVSAMLQSQQAWLPVLQPVQKFTQYVQSVDASVTKLIAHCLEEEKKSIKDIALSPEIVMLIGPEGDFSKKEIELALQQGYTAVTLGETRLRTETAGLVAAVLLVSL
ncbi:MAG: 16S rRNA (uracil(1498)-N(3))-methyltransferase [Ferruginibacter sp.]